MAPFFQLSPATLLMVVQESPILVVAAESTPHLVLPVPNVKIFPGLRTVTSSYLTFFRPNPERRDEDLVHVMQKSLARLLVPYYPLAGRLRVNERGKMEVACHGDGAVFVEAYANATLTDLWKLDRVYWAQLQYSFHKDEFTEVPPLIVQVTRLACGGFVLGIQVCQSLLDAAGFVHFLNGWAEIVQGRGISIFPVWEREFMMSQFGSPRFHFPNFSLLHRQETFRCEHDNYISNPITRLALSSETIHSLRKHLIKEGAINYTISEALAAHVWREWIRAHGIPYAKEVRLFFQAGVSKTTEQHLHYPTAFYGHYAFNCQVATTAGTLLDRPLSHAVHLITAAKASLEENFARCVMDFADLHCPRGCPPSGVLLFSHDLSKTMTESIDFGWGEPQYLDALHYPLQTNVAAIVHVPQDPGSLNIVMRNFGGRSVEKLQLDMGNMSYHSNMKFAERSTENLRFDMGNMSCHSNMKCKL